MHAGERSFLVVAALLSAACTRLLGIDDEYVLENADLSEPTGGTASTPDAEGPGGAPWVPTGGTSGEAGAGSVGGIGGGGNDGARAGIGGEPPLTADSGPAPPPPIVCDPGVFRGTLSGEHVAAAIPIIDDIVRVFIQANVDLTFQPAESPTQLSVSSGHVEGTIGVGTSVVVLSAAVTGTLDCTTGEFDGQLLEGLAGAVATPWFEFAGVITGTLVDGAGDHLSGTWTESDITGVIGTGQGNWSAERTED